MSPSGTPYAGANAVCRRADHRDNSEPAIDKPLSLHRGRPSINRSGAGRPARRRRRFPASRLPGERQAGSGQPEAVNRMRGRARHFEAAHPWTPSHQGRHGARALLTGQGVTPRQSPMPRPSSEAPVKGLNDTGRAERDYIIGAHGGQYDTAQTTPALFRHVCNPSGKRTLRCVRAAGPGAPGRTVFGFPPH